MYMKIPRKWGLGIILAILVGLGVAACGAPAQPETVTKVETVVVKETVEVEKEVVKEVVQTVEVIKEVAVVATPEPVETPKVALIVSGQAQDQSWNQFMYNDAQALADRGEIELSVAEDVTPADFERVAADYADQGYDLIVGHTSDYLEPAIKVATEYPDIDFAITGATDFLPNLAGLNNWGHQTSALAGALAAMMTETGKVGIVGGFASPTQFVYHEGFKFGVYMVNRDNLEADPNAEQVECLETFTGTWFDSAIGYEAGIAQMDQGADWIYISLSGPGFGVIQAAQETGKAKVIGTFVDMNEFAPDVVVTSVERHADLPLQAILADIRNGTFTGKDYSFDHTNGGTALSPLHNWEDKIPDEVKERLADYEKKIVSGQGAYRVPFVTAKLGGETGCTVQSPSG
jgi:basic membrane protein A